MDIQSILAIGIVAVAVGIFIYSTFIKKGTSCGMGCGCNQKNKKDPSKENRPSGEDQK